MKLEICAFSGFKIYPGHGQTFVRADAKAFRFINSKSASYFKQRLNPRKLHWTVVFRRMHRKGLAEEVSKKRTRKTVKHQRAIVGASLDVLRSKRNQSSEVRAAARAEALKAAKDKKSEQQGSKRADKAKTAAAARGGAKGPKASKMQAKGSAPKVQAKSR
ncbi:60S ribosomal protein L24 [Sorochytrium milnesiophthora]